MNQRDGRQVEQVHVLLLRVWLGAGDQILKYGAVLLVDSLHLVDVLGNCVRQRGWEVSFFVGG